MNNVLRCPLCEYDYIHLIGTIEVIDNDEGQAIEFMINHKHSLAIKTKYEYRSQGNIHLLFRCEDGHFFIKSFDGHKGNVFMDENTLMDELTSYLNEVYQNEKNLFFTLSFELLGNIEKFLKTQKID